MRQTPPAYFFTLASRERYTCRRRIPGALGPSSVFRGSATGRAAGCPGWRTRYRLSPTPLARRLPHRIVGPATARCRTAEARRLLDARESGASASRLPQHAIARARQMDRAKVREVMDLTLCTEARARAALAAANGDQRAAVNEVLSPTTPSLHERTLQDALRAEVRPPMRPLRTGTCARRCREAWGPAGRPQKRGRWSSA